MESSLEFSASPHCKPVPPLRSRTFKVIVIGNSGVGKTCLAYRFSTGRFPDKTEATIGVDFRERLIDVEGEKIKMQLWDTAGQERFRKSMVQHYYRNVHAIVLVYDVTNEASFQSLPVWMEECRQNLLGYDIPRILVGNKSDLVSTARVAVSAEQARRFADAHDMQFYQTSAKGHHGDQVEAVFMMLAHRLKRQRPLGGACFPMKAATTSSFKIPQKNKPEKEKWSCTC
ncbi:ras-related protein Rab-33B-like [Chanos chanos]|uniref:Ras-related protein Rab-33B-like n=1 Tax=Chanos chanos TaxID=29144 RepID=A0A6J2WDP5_CHACN|nr:ras-related protein Rab-33B-like [Chanos chanos]